MAYGLWLGVKVVPHEAVVALGVGIEALPLDGFAGEPEVGLEGLIGIVFFYNDSFFLSQADVVAGFGGEALH